MFAGLQEGFVSLLAGANNSIDSSLISETQYAKGRNISSRGGLIKSRSPFDDACSLANAGKWQGGGLYRLNGTDRFVYVIDGVVSSVNISTSAITTHYTFSNTDFEVAYMCQSDKYFIVQNGLDEPIVLDMDLSAPNIADQSALEEQEQFRRGKVMAYGHGRTFVAVNRVWNRLVTTETTDGEWADDLGYSQFCASDNIQSEPNTTYSNITFNQDTIIDGGGAMKPMNEMGFIHGMSFLRNAQTGTGIGSLVVFCKDGTTGYQIDLPRSSWTDAGTQIGQTLFFGTGTGTMSPRSIVNVNDDLVYRSLDGIRTIRYSGSSMASTSGSLSCLPLSTEVNHLLALDTLSDLPMASSVFIDNRLYVTTGGRDAETGAFKCLAVLDTANVSALGKASAMSWDGCWTGEGYLEVFKSFYDDRECLYAVVSVDGGIRMQRLSTNAGCLTDPSMLFTRTYGFMTEGVSNIFSAKEFRGCELWLKNITTDISLTMYYRADGYELWSKCETVNIEVGEGGELAQNRYRVVLFPAVEGCSQIDGRLSTVGSAIQFCFQWTGSMTIQRCKLGANAVEEQGNYICNNESVTTISATDSQVELYDYK